MTSAPALSYWIGAPHCAASLDEAAVAAFRKDLKNQVEGIVRVSAALGSQHGVLHLQGDTRLHQPHMRWNRRLTKLHAVHVHGCILSRRIPAPCPLFCNRSQFDMLE